MMTESRNTQSSETQQERISRVRRYLSWMRNLQPYKRRTLVIEPLAALVLAQLKHKQAHMSQPVESSTHSELTGWHLHDTVYLLTDGKIYDTSDRTTPPLGMKASNQEPVIDALVGLIPGSRERQLMVFENFVRNEALSGIHWEDKAGKTAVLETASSPS